MLKQYTHSEMVENVSEAITLYKSNNLPVILRINGKVSATEDLDNGVEDIEFVAVEVFDDLEVYKKSPSDELFSRCLYFKVDDE